MTERVIITRHRSSIPRWFYWLVRVRAWLALMRHFPRRRDRTCVRRMSAKLGAELERQFLYGDQVRVIAHPDLPERRIVVTSGGDVAVLRGLRDDEGSGAK